MLQKIASILLLFAVLSPTIQKGFILTDFAINQDYIAKYLCINKDIPKSNCNGKCYLSQIINEGDQTGTQAPSISLLHFIDSVVFLDRPVRVPQLYKFTIAKPSIISPVSLTPCSQPQRLFRPPKVGSSPYSDTFI